MAKTALSSEQLHIVDFMAAAYGEGLTLAYDIAVEFDLSPRGIGQKLQALERRGLVRRAVAVRQNTKRSDLLYGWEVTEAGWRKAIRMGKERA